MRSTGGSVLIVDDAEMNRDLLSWQLRLQGYTISVAYNGRHAFELIQALPIDLEKIKTIGDAYMVVGRLPLPRADHAEAVAEMALAMQQNIARFKAANGEPFSLRIGINTGPVVAGVIGTKKFSYDLWGDTVNTASRMESLGLANCIQVTAATYERLRGKYLFAERGMVQVKGKGEMLTYLLLGKKDSHRLG